MYIQIGGSKVSFVYDIPTKVFFGEGQVENLGTQLSVYGSRVLLVYGGGSIKKTGVYDKIVAQIKGAGLELYELSGIEPNPKVESVRRGIEICKKNKIDVCLGGRHSDGTWWGLHIDLFPGFMYFGIPYMDSAAAYAERVLEKDSFYRLGGLSDVASFIKEIIPNRRTKKDYYPRARMAYAANPNGVKAAMAGCYGAKGWAIVEKLLSRECSDAEIFRDSKRLVRALWWRQIAGFHWLSLAKIKFNNIRQRYGRLL